VISYLITSTTALRLTRLTRDQIEAGSSSVKIECTFPNVKIVKARIAKPKKASKAVLAELSDAAEDDIGESETQVKRKSKSRPVIPMPVTLDDQTMEYSDDIEAMAYEEDFHREFEKHIGLKKKSKANDEEDDGSLEGGWTRGFIDSEEDE